MDSNDKLSAAVFNKLRVAGGVGEWAKWVKGRRRYGLPIMK